MRSRFLHLAVSAMSVAVATAAGYRPTAWAQDTVPVAKAPAASPPAYPTLKSALEVTAWNDAERGPLLAVAPERVKNPETPAADGTQPVGSSDASEESHPPLLPPREGFGLNASLVARHFGRRLVSIGSLTVLAPIEMVELNRNLKPANPYHDFSTEDKMRRLEATLSPSQWTLLGEPNGLGLGDMSQEQQPLFDALLPDTVRIARVKIPTPEEALATSPGNVPAPPVTILSPTERAAVRIRLDRTAILSLVGPDSSQLASNHAFSSDAVGTQTLTLQDDPAKEESEAYTVQGQPLIVTRTNALKKSDLDLHTPDMEATIPVAGLRTVGDLVRVIRTKLGREIYVDSRLGRLTLYMSPRARSARAGDLLEALCWAMTATFRKVGDSTVGAEKDVVYILTNDREGIAVRSGLISEWMFMSQIAQFEAQRALKKDDPSLRGNAFAHYASGDLQALTPEAESLLETDRQNGKGDSLTIPVSALSDEQRRQFQASLELFAKMHSDDNEKPIAPRTDRIGVQPSLGLTLVIPGVGEIRQTDTWNDPRPPVLTASQQAAVAAEIRKPYQSEPIAVRNAIVCLAPRTVGEIASAMDALKSRGITALWLRTPETPAGRELLAQCVVVGQQHDMPIGALISLMQVSPETLSEPLPATLEDHNVFGETGAEAHARIAAIIAAAKASNTFQRLRIPAADSRIAPDSPTSRGSDSMTTQTLLEKRVGAIAAIPGLAALAWDHAATRGYGWRGISPDLSFWAGADFGYSLPNRVAMIRRTNFDPIDIAADNGRGIFNASIYLPFFDPTQRNDALEGDKEAAVPSTLTPPVPIPGPDHLWRDFRAQQQTPLLDTLRAGLYVTHPKLALFLTPDASADSFERWDRPTDPLWIAADVPKPSSVATSATAVNRLYQTIVVRADALEALQKQLGEPAAAITAPQLLAATIKRQLRPSRRAPKFNTANALILDLSTMPADVAVPLLEAALLPTTGTNATR